jgi:anti-anti-sigma factor
MLNDGHPSAIRPKRPALHLERVRLPDNGYAVTLGGELDIQTAVELREDITAILAERPLPPRVEIDLRDVTFIDSLGLGTLVVGHRICAEMGVTFTVRNPSGFVAHLLGISGFADRLLATDP